MKHDSLMTAKQLRTVSVRSTPWCHQSTSSEVFLTVVCRRVIPAALSSSVDHPARGKYVR